MSAVQPTDINGLITTVLDNEGGYQDDPADSGNWTGGSRGKGNLVGTKYGITPITYARYLDTDVGNITPQDMKNLSKEEASNILKEKYLIEPKIDRLPEGIRGFVFDFGVNAGPPKAIKRLQSLVGVTVDGHIGPETVKATKSWVNDLGENEAMRQLVEDRNKFYRELTKNDPSKKKFLDGWLNRSLSFYDEGGGSTTPFLERIRETQGQQGTGINIMSDEKITDIREARKRAPEEEVAVLELLADVHEDVRQMDDRPTKAIIILHMTRGDGYGFRASCTGLTMAEKVALLEIVKHEVLTEMDG